MARTVITPLVPTAPRITLTYTNSDALNGNAIPNSGQTLFMANNPGVTSANITIKAPIKLDGDLTVSDRVISVPALSQHLLGHGYFDASIYNQTDGAIYVDCSAVLGLLAIAL